MRLESTLFLELLVNFPDEASRGLVGDKVLTLPEITANRGLQELGVVRYDWRLFTLDFLLLHLLLSLSSSLLRLLLLGSPRPLR